MLWAVVAVGCFVYALPGVFAMLGGWLAISYYFLGRPLRYLDEIVAARCV